MPTLYKKMNVVRMLQERLSSREFSESDIEYLSSTLKKITQGEDANVAFGIKPSAKGKKRSSFIKHQKIKIAFHMIMAKLDPTSFEYIDGVFVEKEGQSDPLDLKKAVYEVADALKINRNSL